MRYLLDSNTFIEAERRFYAHDFCPAFWDFLVAQFENEESGSIMKVYDEILTGGDNLSDWMKDSLGRGSFVDQSADAAIFESYQKVFEYVSGNSQYKESARRSFLSSEEADPWLCAYAMTYSGVTVVTQEAHDPKIRKRVPLPNVLTEFGVPCIDVFTFLRTQKARFVLHSK